jgi:hypothetical protein
VRRLVAASWKRSLSAGVAPDAPGAPVVLAGDALELARARSPLAPAIAAITATLSPLETEARHMVAISDADANLLWVMGDPAIIDAAREMRFQEGAAWAESTAGTNAVGTAAALDHPIQIFSAEHLVAVVHPWTCSAAPIHDPLSGELLGVIDLTAELRTVHPHSLSLAIAAARVAEAALCRTPACATHSIELRLLGRRPCALLGGREERALRSLELLAALAMHPEGMTAEQLALAMYGERGKAVTIRAQLHRLRAKLGEGVLDTHPYRLLVEVDGDWLNVQRLIRSGRPGVALAAYCGELLPYSDAPLIRETRGLLEESLRRSVITTADGELLARWLAHPAGRDDLAAARALVAVLPAGDPRRAAATATVTAVARRLS